MFRSQKSEIRSQKSEVRILLCLFLLLTSNLYGLELVRQKNAATYITFPIVDADGDIVTSAAALDSEIDTWSDGAAPESFGDCTNEASEIGSTGIYYLLLTQGEMNVDYAYVQIKTSTSGAKTQHILIRTIVGDPLFLATTDDGGTINVTTGKIDEVSSLTSHTAQTGDSYAIVLANLDVVLSDVNEVLDTEDPNVWYVAKTGSDSSGGNRRNDALLTIGQAVTNAQSGDTIIIAPGDYDESVNLDTANKSLTIEGIDRYSCKIVPTTGNGVTLESGSTLRNLSIEALDGGAVALQATSKNDITIQHCDFYGDLDGFNSTTPKRWLVKNCRIRGKADGMNFSVAESCIYDNCMFETTGTYTTADITNRAAIGSGQAIFNNCQFRGARSDSTAYYVGGIAITGAGAVSFNNSVFSVSAGADSEDGYGLIVTNSGALVSLTGCSFNSVSSSATAYDINNSGGGVVMVSGCTYDTTKTNGTVTQVNSGWAAAVNAEADTALSDYDPPTKTEMDSGFAALNDPNLSDIGDKIIADMDANSTQLAVIVADTNEIQTKLPDGNLPDALDVVAALMADTGITAGGSYTFEDFCEAMGAYILGTWQDKGGNNTVQELLDWEDDATVILELEASATSPYKTTTKK